MRRFSIDINEGWDREELRLIALGLLDRAYVASDPFTVELSSRGTTIVREIREPQDVLDLLNAPRGHLDPQEPAPRLGR